MGCVCVCVQAQGVTGVTELSALWNALPQHLTLTFMTTAAFEIKLETKQLMLEQRYINITIVIIISKADTHQ